MFSLARQGISLVVHGTRRKRAKQRSDGGPPRYEKGVVASRLLQEKTFLWRNSSTTIGALERCHCCVSVVSRLYLVLALYPSGHSDNHMPVRCLELSVSFTRCFNFLRFHILSMLPFCRQIFFIRFEKKISQITSRPVWAHTWQIYLEPIFSQLFLNVGISIGYRIVS